MTRPIWTLGWLSVWGLALAATWFAPPVIAIVISVSVLALAIVLDARDRRGRCAMKQAALAQLAEHPVRNRAAAGSTPAGGSGLCGQSSDASPPIRYRLDTRTPSGNKRDSRERPATFSGLTGFDVALIRVSDRAGGARPAVINRATRSRQRQRKPRCGLAVARLRARSPRCSSVASTTRGDCWTGLRDASGRISRSGGGANPRAPRLPAAYAGYARERGHMMTVADPGSIPGRSNNLQKELRN